MLEKLFNLCHIVLEVFIPLELALNRDDILRVPDLALVYIFKVLLELIELDAELLALAFDVSEALLSLWDRVDVQFPLSFGNITLLRRAKLGEALCCKPAAILDLVTMRS